MEKMIADYMENGFLENIIAMFRQDKSLYPLIGTLLEDERSRVRLGATALIETLSEEYPDNLLAALPGITACLKNTNPTIRGDAANVLGIIGHKDSLPFLMEAADDKNEMVREIVRESIEVIAGAV
jgi:HEAT repeat protein